MSAAHLIGGFAGGKTIADTCDFRYPAQCTFFAAL